MLFRSRSCVAIANGNSREVHDVVELGDGRVPDLRTGVAVLALDLGTKVAEEDHCGLVRAQEQRPDEQVRRCERGRVAAESLSQRKCEGQLSKEPTEDPPCQTRR